MLRKILSLVLNCEKKRDAKTGKVSQRKDRESSGVESSTKMDTRDTKETFPDPWYN